MILTTTTKLKLLSNRRQALNRNYDGADCDFHDCYVAQTYTYDFYDDDVCRNEQMSSFPWRCGKLGPVLRKLQHKGL